MEKVVDIQTVEQKSLSVIEQAKAIIVKDSQTCVQATDFCKMIKVAIKEVKDVFDPIVDAAHQTHKKAVLSRDTILKPLSEVDAKLRRAIGDWQLAEQRRAAYEQARLQREADAKAEKERKALEVKAVKAEEKGKDEKADELRQKAASVTAFAPIVEANIPDGSASVSKDYDFQIVDVNLIPREYMTPNEVLIRRDVKSFKGQRQIPGVRIFEKPRVRI